MRKRIFWFSRLSEYVYYSNLKNIIFKIIKLLFIGCTCNPEGSENNLCNVDSGNCYCKTNNIAGVNCEKCAESFFGFPNCQGIQIAYVEIQLTNSLKYIILFQNVTVTLKVLRVPSVIMKLDSAIADPIPLDINATNVKMATTDFQIANVSNN